MPHDLHDRVGLRLAQMIAADLHARPEWIDLARRNLVRWNEQNKDSPSLQRCYREWQELLDRPVEEVCEILTDPGHHGQRMRQSSPFVGALPPEVVWDVKRRMRHGPAAA